MVGLHQILACIMILHGWNHYEIVNAVSSSGVLAKLHLKEIFFILLGLRLTVTEINI